LISRTTAPAPEASRAEPLSVFLRRTLLTPPATAFLTAASKWSIAAATVTACSASPSPILTSPILASTAAIAFSAAVLLLPTVDVSSATTPSRASTSPCATFASL
jgi:hypothetical protein